MLIHPSLLPFYLRIVSTRLLMHTVVHSCSYYRRRACHPSRVINLHVFILQVYQTVLLICWLNTKYTTFLICKGASTI